MRWPNYRLFAESCHPFCSIHVGYRTYAVFLLLCPFWPQFYRNFMISVFRDLNLRDQINLLSNSIHSLRHLWIHKQDKHINYLYCDEISSNYACDIFPVFNNSNEHLKKLHSNTIMEVNMDNREYSLYSALIILTGGLLEYQHSLILVCWRYWWVNFFCFSTSISSECVQLGQHKQNKVHNIKCFVEIHVCPTQRVRVISHAHVTDR